MEYSYRYRVGLIVQKGNLISAITDKDLVALYSSPSIVNFKPILLTRNILLAYGFEKTRIKKNPRLHYYRYPVYLSRDPSTLYFKCVNFYSELNFKYLHELQDFYSFYVPHYWEIADCADFIYRYGSKYIPINNR